MQYRRAFTPGGSFFFTLVTQERRPVFSSADAVETLRSAFRTVRASRPFEIDAMVVMPDHLHCIWTLPRGDADFPTRWRLIKTWFTKHHGLDGATQAVWQPRYWEHQIRDEADFAHHADYTSTTTRSSTAWRNRPGIGPIPAFSAMCKPGRIRPTGAKTASSSAASATSSRSPNPVGRLSAA